MMPRPTGRGMLYGLGGYCWLTQMGGLEGFALQEAFGFAPGSGGFAARTRRKKETSRGPAAPAPPPGEFASSIIGWQYSTRCHCAPWGWATGPCPPRGGEPPGLKADDPLAARRTHNPRASG